MSIRVNKAMIELNIGFDTIVGYLKSKPNLKPEKDLDLNTKLSDSQYEALQREFARNKFKKSLVKDPTFQKKGKKEKNSKKDIKQLQSSDSQLNTNKASKTAFSKLQIGENDVRLEYKKKFYVCKDCNIKDLHKILSRYYDSLSQKQINRFRASTIKIALNDNDQTFEFVGIDLYEYVMNKIKQSYISSSFKPVAHQKEQTQQHQVIKKKTTVLNIENIEFFDGYYAVSLIENGRKNQAITPFVVHDEYSKSYLRHIHPYFIDRFPKDLLIEYDNEKIIRIVPQIRLKKYIRTLDGNKDIHGEWWEDVQNERKPTLSHCRNKTTGTLKKIVSLKNSYLVSLASMQNDKKLIMVYEVNNGKQEGAFIFTLAMPDNKCAIIFENVSDDADTATEVFVTNNKDYEECVNLVFDYFTNYKVSQKRDKLRRGVYPPNVFRAEEFHRVFHDEFKTWLSTMNQILKQTPSVSKIEFKSGLHVSRDIESRSGNSGTIPKNIHNDLMRRLYSQLCKEYGSENVGTENRIGSKRIDTVVKKSDCYDIYEIKSDPDPFVCVTIALGQIFQYVYLYCPDEIGKMVIVGATVSTPEVDKFLSWFRQKSSWEIYYMNI